MVVVIRRFGVSDPESVHVEAQRGLRQLDKCSVERAADLVLLVPPRSGPLNRATCFCPDLPVYSRQMES